MQLVILDLSEDQTKEIHFHRHKVLACVSLTLDITWRRQTTGNVSFIINILNSPFLLIFTVLDEEDGRKSHQQMENIH